jgi:hypothetical protein
MLPFGEEETESFSCFMAGFCTTLPVMRVQWIPASRSPHAAEVWFGMLFVPLAAAAALLAVRAFPSAVPRCALRHWTGVPCPTCGLFRSIDALTRFDLAAALRHQPLAAALLLGALLFSVYSFFVTALGRRRIRIRLGPRERRVAWGAAAVLLLANWAYLVLTGAASP